MVWYVGPIIRDHLVLKVFDVLELHHFKMFWSGQHEHAFVLHRLEVVTSSHSLTRNLWWSAQMRTFIILSAWNLFEVCARACV